jgi:hypothetical protein
MPKSQPSNLGRWVAEKVQKMTAAMAQQPSIDGRLDVLTPYEDMMNGASQALAAAGVADADAEPVARALRLIKAESDTLNIRREFEADIGGEAA